MTLKHFEDPIWFSVINLSVANSIQNDHKLTNWLSPWAYLKRDQGFNKKNESISIEKDFKKHKILIWQIKEIYIGRISLYR